jgi:hypothetical protein
MIDWTTRILLKQNGIDDLIKAWTAETRPTRWRHSEQRHALGRGGGSSELGVARATGHHFQWGLTLWTRRIQGNSPRGSSNGGGDPSRARNTGRLAPTFGDIKDELQRLADDEIRLHGAARHVEGWHAIGSAQRGLQWSDGVLGRWLGFQYLRIKICRRTGTIYRAFCTKS